MSTSTTTARTMGAFHLGLAIAGMLGILVLRPQLFTGDSTETLGNLADNQTLAFSGIPSAVAESPRTSPPSPSSG